MVAGVNTEGAMPSIRVYRYKDPASVAGWAGWIEPEDSSWMLFVHLDGATMLFRRRDGELVSPQSPMTVVDA